MTWLDVAKNLSIRYLSDKKLANNEQWANAGFRSDEDYATTKQTNFQLQMA